MNIIVVLAPISLVLALVGLAAFFWTVKNGQYEDPQGDAARILNDQDEDGPPVKRG